MPILPPPLRSGGGTGWGRTLARFSAKIPPPLRPPPPPPPPSAGRAQTQADRAPNTTPTLPRKRGRGKKRMTTVEKIPRAALVTGGGKRIGRAIVEALAADGWAVAVHYGKSAAPAEALAADIIAGGGTAVALGADLAD